MIVPLILLMVLCLGMSFYFAMSEAAVVSVNPAYIKRLSSAGDRRALAITEVTARRRVFFGIILIGNNLANVVFTTTGELLFEAQQVGGGYWTILNVLLFTSLILVFGEIIPKTVAIERPDRFSLMLAPSLALLARIFSPLIRGVNYLPMLFLRGVASESAAGRLITEQQIKLALIQSSQDGAIDKEEQELSLKVMEFADNTIERVMTFRGDIISLPAEMTVAEAYGKVGSHGFSRIPIYRNTDEDEIIGFLNVKDLLRAYISDQHQSTLGKLKREISFVPEKKKTLDQMRSFQKNHTSIAMVVDEAGNITGLVSLEDLLEEVVGEIYDEHDEPEEFIHRIGAREFLVDGRLEVDEFNRTFDCDLDDEDYSTVGGVVIGLFGAVPQQGAAIRHAGLRFTVKKMDRYRIDQVKVDFSRPVEREAFPGKPVGAASHPKAKQRKSAPTGKRAKKG